MLNLLPVLIPLAFAAALQPTQVIALIFLLQTPRGRASGATFVAGMLAFQLGLGALFWLLRSRVETSVEMQGGSFDLIVGSSLVLFGGLLLIYALRRLFFAADEDDDAQNWLARMRTVTPVRAGFVGVAFLALDPKDWLVTLSVIDVIAAADAGGAASLLAYLAYILLAKSFLLALLLLTLIAPQQAGQRLRQLEQWLQRHMRPLEIIVSGLLGSYFVYAGGLLFGLWG